MPRMPVYRKENFMQIMQQLLGTYKNGNYQVILLEDGTKIRVNNVEPQPGQSPEDCFIAEFPESMDVCITHKCNMGCSMCYAGCTPDGRNADIMNAKWIDSLHPWTECAIGGGNIFEHPDLIPFLEKLRNQNVIANITLNQQHFIEHINDVMKLSSQGLIRGVGVSVFNPTEQLINYMKAVSNTVAHCIVGVVDESVLKPLMYEDIRLLLLGYKTTGRGVGYSHQHYIEIDKKTAALEDMLPELFKTFRVVSFDNLALQQLHLKDHLTEEQWNRFYMGDDGIEGKLTSATMYVDMPTNSFALNSMNPVRFRIKDDDTVDTMFNYLRENL